MTIRKMSKTLINVYILLRRMYNELVLRRATVRVLPPEPVELKYPPIFLIGPFRSGTTLLRYIIDSHSHIACPPESDFIACFASLLENRKYRIGLARMGYDEEHIIRKVREWVTYFFGNYARSMGKERWADKTPSYVDYLDFILRVFPEAQFIMIYRHGFDQAHSYTRGGVFVGESLEPYVREGEDPRLGSVRYWQEKVEIMMAFEASHPDKCFRIRYEDLCADPEGQLRPLFEFINEPWEPQVLEFYKFPHDKGFEDGKVIGTRGFVISKEHYLSWPRELVDAAYELAGDTLAKLGYSV